MLIQQCFAANLFAGKTIFGIGGGSGINLGVAKSSAAVRRKYWSAIRLELGQLNAKGAARFEPTR